MKKHILITLLATLSFTFSAQAAESCRLSIENFAKLIDANSALSVKVIAKLEKKNITLIDDEDVKAGDLQVVDLIRGDWANKDGNDGFSTWKYTPVPEAKYSYRVKVETACIGICKVFQKEVSDIIGKTYVAPGYRILEQTNSQPRVLARGLVFKNKVRNFKYGQAFVGSQEQVDLAMAIVDDMPKCSKLLKLQAQ